MRPRPVSLLLRPTPPPLALGIVVALAFIAAETLVLYPLRQIAREVSLGVIYLVGVLVAPRRRPDRYRAPSLPP